jgi:hemoglobin/transferrin/lactoferrin receptor protein
VTDTTFRRSLMLGASVLAMASAAPALAQQAATGAGVQLRPVQVEGELPAENTTTIDSARLNLEGAARLDDVLRGTPGVFTRQNAQQPGVAVNIRGFEGAGRVNMSIDGVRQNFRFTGHEAAGFTYVDPNLLAGIDIARGEVTGVGGGALAGTVNFRTLNVDDVVRPGQTHGGLARLSWGTNGALFNNMLAYGVRLENAGVVGAISKRNSNLYHDGNGNIVAGTSQDLLSGLVRANVSHGAHSLSLGAVFYSNYFLANSYNQQIDNRTVSANYRYNPGNPLIDLRVNAYYNQLNMNYTGGTSTSALGREITDDGLGFDISNISRWNLGRVAVRSTNGVEYFHDDVRSANGGVNPGSGTSSQLGVFTNNTFSYGIVDFTAGLRYDHYTLSGSGVTNDRVGAFSVDTSTGSVNPKFTLGVNVTNWLQPYVSWGRSMRSPTLQETMLGGSHPGTTSGSYLPNPNLRPETSQGWEMGVNLRRHALLTERDNLRLRANYFIKGVEDYIAASYVTASRAFRYTNIAGTTQVQGFEVELGYDAGFAFGGINYTNMRSNIPSQVPGLGASQYMPDHVLSVDAGMRFLRERLTLGARYNYVSAGPVATLNSSFTGAAATEGGKPYNIVNLFTNYRVTDSWDVSFRITNLLNESYTPFLSTTGNGQGRTFYLATQIRF